MTEAITFDTATGALIDGPERLPTEAALRIAEQVLGGPTQHEIGEFLDAWTSPEDADEWAVGNEVITAHGFGTIRATRSLDGDVHSVQVKVAGWATDWFSPSELIHPSAGDGE